MSPEHCQQTVHIRDCYRRTGRGKSGFELAYTKRQCSRKAVIGGYCRQHARINHVEEAK